MKTEITPELAAEVREFFTDYCPTEGLDATELYKLTGWTASELVRAGLIRNIAPGRWDTPRYSLTA